MYCIYSYVIRACQSCDPSSGLILTLVCGALELASKNMMSGSVKLIYAIIYSLFVVSWPLFGLS